MDEIGFFDLGNGYSMFYKAIQIRTASNGFVKPDQFTITITELVSHFAKIGWGHVFRFIVLVLWPCGTVDLSCSRNIPEKWSGW